jgi:plasmid stabilization system protein ParE
MRSAFQLTPQAREDIDSIWWHIAEHSRDAAERVELEIIGCCCLLAKHPRMGSKRADITTMPVRFWTVTKFSNYVIVYRPETVPLQVIAVLHGKRDLEQILRARD